MPRTTHVQPVTLAPGDTAIVTFTLDVLNDTASAIRGDNGDVITVYGITYDLVLQPPEEPDDLSH
jgi:hypothetical protein